MVIRCSFHATYLQLKGVNKMINKVKMALRISTDAFDEQIEDLIEAAKMDMRVAGVMFIDDQDPLIIQAVTTYCKINFGEPNNPERLKASYDEQKAQLKMNSDYGEMY